MRRSFLLWCGVGLASCAGGEPAPPSAPPAEEFWFRCAGPLDVRFLHLDPAGGFQFYDRARFATTKGLAGSWRRGGADVLALRCERWSRQAVCGGLRVRFGSAWERQRPGVRSALHEFLAAHPGRERFGQEELEALGCWEEERDLPGGRERVTVIPVSSGPDGAARAEVEGLVRAIDDYGRDGDPHEVHARLHRHRGVEFLEWVDWSGYADPVSPAEVRAAIERLEPGEQLADVWTGLGSREIDRELFWGDRFRFFKAPKPVR
jgi:hypothetical protein